MIDDVDIENIRIDQNNKTNKDKNEDDDLNKNKDEPNIKNIDNNKEDSSSTNLIKSDVNDNELEETNNVLFIKNVSFESTEEDLKNIFTKYDPNLKSIKLISNKTFKKDGHLG